MCKKLDLDTRYSLKDMKDRNVAVIKNHPVFWDFSWICYSFISFLSLLIGTFVDYNVSQKKIVILHPYFLDWTMPPLTVWSNKTDTVRIKPWKLVEIPVTIMPKFLLIVKNQMKSTLRFSMTMGREEGSEPLWQKRD